ncbi:hypothetical protein EON69_00895 [bacterium]|nr:MAG: hypothetical protein EON69_00895 [bacterium]
MFSFTYKAVVIERTFGLGRAVTLSITDPLDKNSMTIFFLLNQYLMDRPSLVSLRYTTNIKYFQH